MSWLYLIAALAIGLAAGVLIGARMAHKRVEAPVPMAIRQTEHDDVIEMDGVVLRRIW